MPLVLALLLLVAAPQLVAQDYSPDLPRLEEMTTRYERGDGSVRRQLEREGRPLIIWAAQRRVRGATAHLVARIGFIFGTPFTDPDSTIPRSELFWRGGIVSALLGALAVDSGDVRAAELLEGMASYPHVWLEAEREFRQLRALARIHDSLPLSLTLAWLGMELERGDPDTAAAALARVPLGSIGAVRWHHLAAQVAFARGDSIAPKHYRNGASAIRDSVDAATYRADIGWFAEPEELAEWDALPFGGTAHAEWLEQFWTRRDLEDLRLPGTRLRDHFARWRLALREYRWDVAAKRIVGWRYVPKMGLEYNETTDIPYPRSEFMQSELAYAGRYRPLSILIDDRGIAVMRHGPPDYEVVLPGITDRGQTLFSWHQPTGPLVLSYSRPAISLTVTAPSELWGMIARSMPVGDLLAGCRVDAELCGLAGLVAAKADINNQSIRTRSRYDAMRRTAEVTEDNSERFAKPLEAYIQAYGVAGGEVLVSYAIRASDLADGAARIRIVAGDLARGTVVNSVESERRWTIPEGAAGFVAGWTVLPVPVGSWRIGVVLADAAGERGNGVAFDRVPVVGGAGGALRMSDPIVGRVGSGLRWSGRGATVPLNPTGAWQRGEPGELHVEVLGLVPGRQYALAIALREGGDAEAPARVVISESLEAGSSTVWVQRVLSFENLEPGDYRLVVRVTDPLTGDTVERERMVPVR
jgi:hypothetical protein